MSGSIDLAHLGFRDTDTAYLGSTDTVCRDCIDLAYLGFRDTDTAYLGSTDAVCLVP